MADIDPCKFETCAFHDKYERKVEALWDWHLTSGESIKQLVEKIKTTNTLLVTFILAIATDVVLRVVG